MDLDSCRSCGNYSPKDMYCHLHLKGIERISSCAVRDLVSVVRCKDCRFWDTDWSPAVFFDPEDVHKHLCDANEIVTNGEWFCANGERKGDENG